MKFMLRLALAALGAGLFGAAGAETLRCNGHTVEAGDSKLSVRYYCGDPLLQEAHCAPVYYSPNLPPVPEPFANSVVPCVVVDEWLYDRGPGNLVATVRFRANVVQSIAYGTRAAR